MKVIQYIFVFFLDSNILKKHFPLYDTTDFLSFPNFNINEKDLFLQILYSESFNQSQHPLLVSIPRCNRYTVVTGM